MRSALRFDQRCEQISNEIVRLNGTRAQRLYRMSSNVRRADRVNRFNPSSNPLLLLPFSSVSSCETPFRLFRAARIGKDRKLTNIFRVCYDGRRSAYSQYPVENREIYR